MFYVLYPFVTYLLDFSRNYVATSQNNDFGKLLPYSFVGSATDETKLKSQFGS
jgi:hypothetical protein